MRYRETFTLCIFLVAFVGISSQVTAQSPAENEQPAKPAATSQPQVEQQAQIGAIHNQLKATIKKLNRTKAELQSRLELASQSLVSDVAFEDVFRMLHLQDAELTIDLNGLAARLEMLKTETEIGKVRGVGVATQREILRQHYVNQKRRLKSLQKMRDSGTVPEQDVAEAEALLIEAELKLQQFEVNSRKSSPALVEAVFETSLEVAEKKARAERVKEMLARYKAVRPEIAGIEALKNQVAAEERSLCHLKSHLSDIQSKLADEKAFLKKLLAEKAEAAAGN